MPSASSASDKSASPPGSESSPTGTQGDDGAPTQDQAGAAGKKLAQVGKALSSASATAAAASGSSADDTAASSGASAEPWDPLLPEPLDDANTDGDRFDEANAAAMTENPEGDDASESDSGDTAESDTQGTPEASQETSIENPQTAMGGAQSSSAAETGADPGSAGAMSAPEAGDRSDDLQALNEALSNAGIALTTAGELLSQNAGNDTTDGEVDSALSQASVAILILEQQLNQAETSGAAANDRIGEAARLVILANAALAEATLATDGAMPIPNGTGTVTQTGEDQRIAELDAELDRSIVIFEADIQDARNAVAAELSGSNTEVAGGPSMVDLAEGLAQSDAGNLAESVDDASGEATAETSAPQGRAPGETRQQAAGPAPIPEDIPSPQGDDIVAKQLREAAAAEQDPALREKLWDEYKRYKQGL
jgi:hypothetical protein